jgi:AraC family transcriptional regulator
MGIGLKQGQYFGHLHGHHEDNVFCCSITHYEPEAKIGKHYHENDYVSLLIHGKYSENHRLQNQLLEPGNSIFRPALYDHANDFLPVGGACLNIEFKKDWQHNLDLKYALPDSAHIYPTGTFTSLYRLLRAMSEGTELVREYIIDWLSESNPTPVPTRLPWLSKAMQIIENETTQTHTIDSLAYRVCVHPIYLSRAFKQRTGFTVGEYQLKAKITKAMQLLFTTNQPIGEIAIGCGFYDAAHLIRSFRLVYGTTPKSFRNILNG